MPGRADGKGRRERGDGGRYGHLEVAGLVRLIRDGDHGALGEIVRRYRGLLVSYACRFGLTDDDARSLATDVLEDVVVYLIEHPEQIPRSMDAYIVGSFRNRVLSARRDAARRERPELEALDSARAVSAEGVDGPGGCSEAMLHAARGPGWEPPPLSPALELLTTKLDRILSDDERRLVAWVSEYVLQSDIAKWTGLSHAATRKQLERVRRRLAAAAKMHAESLSARDRAELVRFFRRVDDFVIGEPDPANPDQRAAGNA